MSMRRQSGSPLARWRAWLGRRASPSPAQETARVGRELADVATAIATLADRVVDQLAAERMALLQRIDRLERENIELRRGLATPDDPDRPRPE